MVGENNSLSEVLRTAGETAQSTLPVVDSDGKLAGLIVTRDLLSMLSGGQEVGPLVNAYDICNPHCATVNLDAKPGRGEPVDGARRTRRDSGGGSGFGGRFLGLVTRQHIAQALNRVTVSLSTLATRDSEYLLGDRLPRDEDRGACECGRQDDARASIRGCDSA